MAPSTTVLTIDLGWLFLMKPKNISESKPKLILKTLTLPPPPPPPHSSPVQSSPVQSSPESSPYFPKMSGKAYSNSSGLSEDPERKGGGGGLPIPFPSPISFRIPFFSFQIPFPLALFRKIPQFYITSSFVLTSWHFLKLRLVTSFENNPERCPERFTAFIKVVI